MLKILFRLDGASFMGLGHVYQSMALADEFKKRGATISFAIKAFEPEVLSWISSKGIDVFPIPPDATEEQELEQLLPLLLSKRILCVIIDHHVLGYEYTQRLRERGVWVAIIDEEGKRQFCSDLIVNYTIYAPHLEYKKEPYAECLLGPQYAILRNQFSSMRKEKRSGTKLMVIMGGGYARGEVIKVIKSLMLLDPSMVSKIDPQIVLGPAYPSPERVIEKYKHLPVTFHRNPPNIIELMQECNFAISGGGGALYELACMGTPSIIIVLDTNQELNAHHFDNIGISDNLGWYQDVKGDDIAEVLDRWVTDPERIGDRGLKAKSLVDGKGAQRVVSNIFERFN